MSLPPIIVRALVPSAVFACALTAPAAQLQQTAGGKWRLENDRVQVEVDPARGGRVSQFRDQAFSEPLVRDAQNQGLFNDHLTKQNWPGELWNRAYEAKALNPNGPEVALEVSTVIQGAFGGATQPQSQGLVLRKTYRLADGEQGLRVEHRIENPTAVMKQFALWVQNLQHVGADPKQNTTMRPAIAGLYRFKMPDQPAGEGWIRYLDSLAAWYAVLDPESGQAVAYFQDWDFLESHYSAGPSYSMEWFMMPVSIPPGGAWSTASRMISRKVSADLCAISPELWVGASLNKPETAIRLTLGGAAAAGPVEIEGTLYYRAATASRFESLSLAHPFKLALKTGENELPLPMGCVPPVGLSARIVGGGATLALNEFLGGADHPRNEPLPGYAPVWKVPMPEKAPKLPRPDKLVFAAGAAGKALVAHGPMTLGMKVVSALEAGGFEAVNAYASTDFSERGIRGFPGSYEEIMARRLIVMNNTDYRLLRPSERRLLLDYLDAGGGLLLLGGTATTRRSAERNPFFSGAVAPASDAAGTDVTIRPVLRAPGLEAKLFPASAGGVFWSGPESSVIASVEGKAVIAAADVGKGRIVYCGLTGMGAVQPAGYWESPEWAALLKGLAKLAAGRLP